MGANFVGALDEVALFATPLAPIEVQHLYAGDTAALYQWYVGYALARYENGETQLFAPPGRDARRPCT